MSHLPWHQGDDGLRLVVRLTPKSSRDRIEGAEIAADGRAFIKVRVRAVPEAGQANAALLRLLAKNLDLPASRLSLAAGATQRLKILQISGDPADLQDRLSALANIRLDT